MPPVRWPARRRRGTRWPITEKFVGQPVLRKEDAPSLIRGRGSFVDNMSLAGMLHMAVVRSPFAHARVVKVDV